MNIQVVSTQALSTSYNKSSREIAIREQRANSAPSILKIQLGDRFKHCICRRGADVWSAENKSGQKTSIVFSIDESMMQQLQTIHENILMQVEQNMTTLFPESNITTLNPEMFPPMFSIDYILGKEEFILKTMIDHPWNESERQRIQSKQSSQFYITDVKDIGNSEKWEEASFLELSAATRCVPIIEIPKIACRDGVKLDYEMRLTHCLILRNNL